MKLLLSIHKCDVFMFTWLINARIHGTLTHFCRSVSKTGDGQLYIAAIVLLWMSEGFTSPFLHAILLAFLMERPLYFILKNGFRRNRPEAALKDFRSVITPADQFSFPSGHTSAAFMMATLVGYFIPSLMIPLYCWAALIAFSRVVLGVHFPTDTLMGIVLGVGTAAISLGQIL